jgi:hypothetical protein
MKISGMSSMRCLAPTTCGLHGTAASARQLAVTPLMGRTAEIVAFAGIDAKPNTVQRPLGLAGGTTG